MSLLKLFMLTRTICFLLTLLCTQQLLAQISSMPAVTGWTKTETAAGTQFVPSNELAFAYLVFPVNNATEGAGWLETAVKADIKKNNLTEKQQAVMQSVKEVKLYVNQVTDEKSQTRYVCYIGYRFGTHSMRLARTMSQSPGAFEKYTTTAVQHFAGLYEKEKNLPDPPATIARQYPGPKPVVTVQSKPGRPDGGIKPSDMQMVVMHLEYEAGMGGGIYPVYNAYIFLKDGTVYKYPETSPYDLDRAASQKTEPRKWGTWKMNGDKIISNWPAEPRPVDQQETWESKSYYKVPGAKKGETISGVFKSISGGGNTALGGDVMTVSAGTIVLNEKGQFSLTHVAGVMGGDAWETHYGKRADAGSYVLQDYSIELTYHDGHKEKRFFFFYPDSRLHFGIGTTVYMPKKG